MVAGRMDYDDLAWEKSDQVWGKWLHRTLGYGREIGYIIRKYHQGVAVELKSPQGGSFNVCYRLFFGDGSGAIIRFPSVGRVLLPEEKLRAEVATMRFIASNTIIPVPFVLHPCYDGSECSPGLGPFMIMEYVKHHRALSADLEQPGRRNEDRAYLNEDIHPKKLFLCYRKMAVILLQLSRPGLDRIGSLSEVDEDEQSVTERPLTMNMNGLISLGGCTVDQFPSSTFTTASSYYQALANMHLEHLLAQHNDAVESEEDCRRKYVARHLFRKLAAEKRLDTFPEFENGPFRLFCEDLCPRNVLLNEAGFVAGAIDWEFTISGPAGFAFSPPWWLLLKKPDEWHGSLDDWEAKYTRRLETFLDALRDVEREVAERNSSSTIPSCDSLSSRMKRSWDDGAFWINYAAQRSWSFDLVYFGRLDERFFGPVSKGRDWLEERLPLLTEKQRQEMEPFVRLKMAQASDRRLVDDRFDRIVELPENTSSEVTTT